MIYNEILLSGEVNNIIINNRYITLGLTCKKYSPNENSNIVYTSLRVYKNLYENNKDLFLLGKNVYFVDLYELICEPMGLPRAEHSVPENCNTFGSYFPDGIHPNQSGYNKACQTVLNEMHNITGKDGRKLISYKGYPYYQDNPALSIHEPIKEILEACGIIKK